MKKYAFVTLVAIGRSHFILPNRMLPHTSLRLYDFIQGPLIEPNLKFNYTSKLTEI